MSILFTPGNIGLMTLKNRFVRSATRELLAANKGRLSKSYISLYSRLARGGVGLIVPGGYYVRADGLQAHRCIVVDRDEIMADLQALVEVVHKHGAKIVAQLNHCGRQSDPKVIGHTPLGPSPVRDKRTKVKPRQMKQKEIEQIIVAFGNAARRVKEAGFDGVQIHAAHGYLVNQFLSAYTNRRRDKWGGSIENRMLFLTEIYKLVRSITGNNYPILVKINGEDYVKRGITIDETKIVCSKLDELGIDAIEVSGGIGEVGLFAIRGDIPIDLLLRNRGFVERVVLKIKIKSIRNQVRFKEAFFLSEAAAIKSVVKSPVIAVGGIRSRSTMERVLESGQADFISMSRPFICQPNLVNEMEKSDQNSILCSNCNRCSIEVLVHQNPLRCYNLNVRKKANEPFVHLGNDTTYNRAEIPS
jgi:2,4-dienoyl-CoA reductase-like NADH-dependent reductase (Old Yellow Enzyme family)